MSEPEIRYTAAEHSMPGKMTYEQHRANAKKMSDEMLMRNQPRLGENSDWAHAMRDEARSRGLRSQE